MSQRLFIFYGTKGLLEQGCRISIQGGALNSHLTELLHCFLMYKFRVQDPIQRAFIANQYPLVACEGSQINPFFISLKITALDLGLDRASRMPNWILHADRSWSLKMHRPATPPNHDEYYIYYYFAIIIQTQENERWLMLQASCTNLVFISSATNFKKIPP